jgi:hypothetical protein
MRLREFIRRNSRHMALGLNALFGVFITTASIIHFNRTPHPSAHAQLGTVAINLELLDNRLTCEALLAAGMLQGIDPGKCNFSRDRSRPYLSLEGFADHRFLGTLFHQKSDKLLWLHFYGSDVPAGQQRLDRSLQQLRAQFPGRADAIRKLAGPEEHLQLMREWR